MNSTVDRPLSCIHCSSSAKRPQRSGVVRVLFCGALLLIGGLSHSLAAQPLSAGETDKKISVSATGTASVKPDVAEIRTVLRTSASLATDALKKFRANRRRAIERFNGLKLKDLAIEGGGQSISSMNPGEGNQMAFFAGQANNANPDAANLVAAETLLIRLPAIDTMKEEQVIDAVVKIVDAAKDSGLTLASVRFKSSNVEKYRAEAVRDAMKSARQKAETLAAASNAKVGPVLSVSSSGVDASTLMNDASPESYVMSADGSWTMSTRGEGGASIELTSLKVSAPLHIEFALERSR